MPPEVIGYLIAVGQLEACPIGTDATAWNNILHQVGCLYDKMDRYGKCLSMEVLRRRYGLTEAV